MKLLNRLREGVGTKATEVPALVRTEGEITKDIDKALCQGNFYAFCYYQAEYKELTGKWYELPTE